VLGGKYEYVVRCGSGTGLCWMVNLLKGVGVERIVLDDNCVVGCGSGTVCVGWFLWSRVCVCLERILLDGNCVVGCGSGTDCVGW
jgi:hypothetical protein